MGGISWVHILLLALVILVLFGGRGKISDFMGDFAKGIKSFKKGLADEETPPPPPPRTIEAADETKKDTAAH